MDPVIIGLLVVLLTVAYFLTKGAGKDASSAPAEPAEEEEQKAEAEAEDQEEEAAEEPSAVKAPAPPPAKVETARTPTIKTDVAVDAEAVAEPASGSAKKKKKSPKKKSPKKKAAQLARDQEDDDMKFLEEQIKVNAREERDKADKLMRDQDKKEKALNKQQQNVALNGQDLARLRSAVYTFSNGQKEVVKVIKTYSAAEGGAVSIWIPSLGRERQTLPERVDLTPLECDKHLDEAPVMMGSPSVVMPQYSVNSSGDAGSSSPGEPDIYDSINAQWNASPECAPMVMPGLD